MEIAATGFALPLLSPVRDRPQARPDVGQSTAGNRRDTSSLGLATGSADRNEREVRGEVIYTRPEQGRTSAAAQTRLANDAAAFTASGNRRFSVQAAIQAFRENEAMVTEPGESRQVSGIIDEYV